MVNAESISPTASEAGWYSNQSETAAVRLQPGEYRVYVRREHPVVSRIVWITATLIPLAGCMILLSSTGTRIVVLIDYALVAIAVAALARISRWSQSRRSLAIEGVAED